MEAQLGAPDSQELPKTYSPNETEARWYKYWEEHGLFAASSDPNDKRPAYTIAIPPPNVTGSLHMGHACRTTFEDVLIRYKRMLGFNALWIPGTDHAGIATQVVVERQLAAEGKTRHDLGREKFVERVWKWKGESGDRILHQLREMGASCDWARAKFTMDPDLSRGVREVFVRLYEEGLIYRATRLVHWDVESLTVLSDLEVETEENVQGELYSFAYPIEGGGEVIVSTTRPETMLGDTAVAIHPEDERYTSLHGKFVLHPFNQRRIPIICDAELVDRAFGTGVVKVTPAHDWNDFATGKRHQLEEINILNKNGTLNENGAPFQGLDRFAARKAVKAKLEELGLARGAKPHVMTLPRSQRSRTIVEPMISTQWFVRMEPLAKPAIEAVEDGRVKIIPEEWTKTYFHWMRNIQDWTISRQLWWGHSIPASYCDDCEHINVSREDVKQCAKCGSSKLTADPDVLDTWFSSALWPFSTLGWPEKTFDLTRFYPTSDLETGFDILFFWVARMIMMGMHFMGDVPFRRVLLAGLVTDERGDKMSKVKGNVVDPLDVIRGATLDDLVSKAEKGGAKPAGIDYLKKTYPEGFAAYGADALRMTLLSYPPQARKIALSIKRIEGYRNFSTKLWNAARYSLSKLGDARAGAECPKPKALANRFILSRLDSALRTTRAGLDEYRLDDASNALYHFVWGDFCDWYLELSKPLLASDDLALVKETQETLCHVLETTMRALHPMMPFITEELWQRIPKHPGVAKGAIIARFPEPGVDARADADAERDAGIMQRAITAVRTIRAEHDLPPSKEIPAVLRTDDAHVRALLTEQRAQIVFLTRSTVSIEAGAAQKAPERTAVAVAEGVTVWVPLAGLVDVGRERERVTRELAKLEKDLASLAKKLGNAEFLARAPAELVAKDRERIAELESAKARLTEALGALANN